MWHDGVLPPASQPFNRSLTEDLLDYAYSVFSMSLQLQMTGEDEVLANKGFCAAGEAIEAAVHRGAPDRCDLGFHRVNASVAFHLACHAARAFSVLPADTSRSNLAPTEVALVHLLRRSLDEMHDAVAAWLLDEEHTDASVARRLVDDDSFDQMDAVHVTLTTFFMRGLALFDHAVTTGTARSASEAKRQLTAAAEIARDLDAVNHWWTATLASRLIDELWKLSMYEQIPVLPPGEGDCERWREIRRSYIDRLRISQRSAIELWPSQLEAAHRAADSSDDLVVALPTGAGKTRIAELCILRVLASERRAVYVAPLRALSSQVERNLSDLFAPLGFSVSSLYGSAGTQCDADTLRERSVVVCTPEKLDFALRNDPTVIDDVGLVVLDEGHMFGPDEREVRYECLVQRLLRRTDSSSRRIVCLSALFPDPSEMRDLIAWIRQDEPGDPVYCTWRPTKQRFGVLRWEEDSASLEVAVESQTAAIPNFIESHDPPEGSRRRTAFPRNKNELTLAGAWRSAREGKDVLIYCPLRSSVQTLGDCALDCIRHGVLQSLTGPREGVQDAIDVGIEWLGRDHVAVRCLEQGIALHHGGLHRAFLSAIERLLRNRQCPITIASPTLAQGLNLSASVVLVSSTWRNGEPIPEKEFVNVAGRAGRPFVDAEGLVLCVLREDDNRRARRALRRWKQLIGSAQRFGVESGLLALALRICEHIADRAAVPCQQVIDHMTGYDYAWMPEADLDATAMNDLDRDIASLDCAILGLLDTGIDGPSIEDDLSKALEGSLFSRQLERQTQEMQTRIRDLILARSARIWADTTEPERRGYRAAGIGLRAGKFLSASIDEAFSLLVRAEEAMAEGDESAAADAIVEFAGIVFRVEPFLVRSVTRSDRWREALRAWVTGQPTADVVALGGDDGADLLGDAFTYRLPWAMEAVRVHASAISPWEADLLHGYAVQAVESGCTNMSAMILLQNGLQSREAAIAAVKTTDASLWDQEQMIEWLESDDVGLRTVQNDWPTREGRHAWVQFLSDTASASRASWARQTQRLRVKWHNGPPDPGTMVVVQPDDNGGGLILAKDFRRMGCFTGCLRRERRFIVNAYVGEQSDTVSVEFFGPSSGP